MLPRTVRNDLSLLVQIALNAIPAASRNWFTLARLAARHRSTLTAEPSAISRTESKGPAMTWSPSFRPESDLEVFLSGNTRLDRSELRLAVADDKDPLELLARTGRVSARSPALPPGRPRGAPVARRFAHDRRSLSSTTISRTVVAWIGTDRTLLRLAVVISAVHVKPGPHVRNLGIERDHDLEIGRLRTPPARSPGWGCCRFRSLSR